METQRQHLSDVKKLLNKLIELIKKQLSILYALYTFGIMSVNLLVAVDNRTYLKKEGEELNLLNNTNNHLAQCVPYKFPLMIE